ncbi:MAG: hypothetical protein Q7T30_02555 [Planctomycetota bacterium]|nr:hypothetical protein [Planctomycetota bacterium]
MSDGVVKSRLTAWLAGLALLVAALLLWWNVALAPEQAPGIGTSAIGTEPARDEGTPVPEARAAVQRVPVLPGPAPSPEMGDRAMPLRSVEVFVRDEQQRPVQGALIALSRDGDDWLSEAVPPAKVAATTDGHGKALLKAVPGEMAFAVAVQLRVGASSFREVSRKGRVELTIAACDTEVRGCVVDHLGRGIAGVDVELLQNLPIYCGMRKPAEEPDPRIGAIQRRTVTGADGVFVFKASRSWGSCRVMARLGRIDCGSPVLVDAAATVDPVRLELPGRVRLRGVVVDWHGQIVPDCEIWAGHEIGPDGFAASFGNMTTTDAAGRFEVPFFEGGRCKVIPLGNEASPAGPLVEVDLPDVGSGWVELHTAEPASHEGTALGMLDARPTRILARPADGQQGGIRESHLVGNGDFVLHGLMRGVRYDVFAYQRDEQVAQATAKAGNGKRIVLRGIPRGDSVVRCQCSGDGVETLAAKYVSITVHAMKTASGRTKLGEVLAEQSTRPAAAVSLGRLPVLPSAVAVVWVDGVEFARSAPFALGEVAADVTIEVPGCGTIELHPTIPAEGPWIYAQLRYGDGTPLEGRTRSRVGVDRPFRYGIPAGNYVVRISDAFGAHPVDLPCVVVAGQTTTLRIP